MSRLRLQQIIFMLGGVLAILIGRMFELQVLEHETWAERAHRSRLEKRTLHAPRGRILDRDGVVLAEDRRSFDLMFEYRAFRRGQTYGQLFELGGLLGYPIAGLDECHARAQLIARDLLQTPPERLRALSSRRQGDALFYLRKLSDMSWTRGEELKDWARAGTLPFVEQFPEAEQAWYRSIERANRRLADLAWAIDDRLGEALMQRLERERLKLELWIRRGVLRASAAIALDCKEWEVLAQFDPKLAPRDEREADDWKIRRYFALDTLRERWQWSGTHEELALYFVATEGQERTALEHGKLLAQIERVAPESIRGLRRDLSARIHRDRVARLIRGVEFTVVDRIAQDPTGFSGLQIELASERIYPEPTAPQLVGGVSLASDSDLDRFELEREELRGLASLLRRTPEQEARLQELRPLILRSAMRAGEVRGSTGIEASFENVLRGERGYLRELAGGEENGQARELEFVPSVSGMDVQLSLSAELNALAERAIRRGYQLARERLDAERAHLDRPLRQPRAGFALLDLRDGSVPVLATAPSYAREDLREHYEEFQEDIANNVFRNRALGGNALGFQTPYPGSTFKPLIALLALERDAAAAKREIYCGNLWLPESLRGKANVQALKCRNHSARSLDMHEALKLSCNTYFYTLAHELGWQAIWTRSRELGFGAPTGIEVVEVQERTASRREGEYDDGRRFRPTGPNAGLETGANFLDSRHRAFNGFTNARFGIGQVSVHASPLQMARFYGWLATGELLTPRLVLRSGGGATAVPEPDQVRIDPGVQRMIQDALLAVTTDPAGTAYDDRYRLDVFGVAGKTGTAQPSQSHPTHGWFAGYFPADEPRYAFAILCENVDLHGGEIANIVLHEFLSSEEFRAYQVANGE